MAKRATKNVLAKWPADAVERRPLSDLLPYANNARVHPEWQIAQIAKSIEEFGWTIPILVDEAGGVIAGHGRILAAMQLGLGDAPCMVARGWSDEKKRAYVLADNKLALNASWDEALLAAELRALQNSDYLDLIGFDATEIEDIFRFEDADGETGSLLERASVTIDEPLTETAHGQVWKLGRHTMVIADTLDHKLWRDRLDDSITFAPYVGPFALASEAAKNGTLLIVQPEKFIAGHIVDRFREMFPDELVECE